MKIAFFAPYAFCSPHFETELELLENLLLEGHEVIVLGCDSDMLVCDWNREQRFDLCVQCISRRKQGLALLSSRVKSRSFLELSRSSLEEIRALPKSYRTVEDLRALTVEDFELGTAVLGSLMTWQRNPMPELRAQARLVEDLLVSTLAVYRSIQGFLDKTHVDRVYCFNGRLAPFRAVLGACRSRAVECYVHERGCDWNHYELFRNTNSWNREALAKPVLDAWERGPVTERETIGRAFFEEKLQGRVDSFMNPRTLGTLPLDWDPSRRNIAIFGSSEDEIAGSDESWWGGLYANQLEGMLQLLRSLDEERSRNPARLANLRLYYRLHPFLSGVHNPYVESLRTLQDPVLTVIQPEEVVNSYTLLKAAECVMSFGSTIGIEASYWGKPSILLGRAIYEDFGGTYNPESHQEAMELLWQQLPAKDPLAALKYGYYFMTYGRPFRHFSLIDHPWGEFKGHRVEPSRWKFRALWAIRVARLGGLANRWREWRTRSKLGIHHQHG